MASFIDKIGRVLGENSRFLGPAFNSQATSLQRGVDQAKPEQAKPGPAGAQPAAKQGQASAADLSKFMSVFGGLDESVIEALKGGRIDRATARRYAAGKAEIIKVLQMVQGAGQAKA